MLGKRVYFAITLLAFIASPQLKASQMAQVEEESASVHQLPKLASPIIAKLKKGTLVQVSTRTVKEQEIASWHKVKLPTGGFGYINVNDIVTASNRQEYRDAAIGPLVEEHEDDDILPWSFLIRGMGIGGYQFGLASNTSTLNQTEFGGEAEVSTCIPLSAHGYMHRLLSVGATFLLLKQEPVIAGSIIIRFYHESTFEPEIRLRFGEATKSNQLVGGLNVGLNFPLSVASQTHWAAYLEMGSLLPVTGNLAGEVLHVWGSAGLGFHF